MLSCGKRFAETLDAAPPLLSPEGFSGYFQRRGGAVGLGIVVAMCEPARSKPIPIRPAHVPASAAKQRERARHPAAATGSDDDECYTCVTSHVGGNPVRKKVYFDDGFAGDGGFFSESPPPAEFLSRCFLCRKMLHGLDIYMYRGEKAFCSAECRCQQILSDEQKEKRWGSKAAKSLKLSASPPILLSASVSAA
ncbi:hypothetical protein AXF42_Ash012125 [Apostasia shenzhenica]|uniref:FLZ-type domain-containing protein n=1 Tax=Apostasia shenzhenica TaxID=1088818 RepID=A0A2I0B420_9ASPA|nr:hypothetical protein AXF42_Ash012125 [Apostasia shenzhenica]